MISAFDRDLEVRGVGLGLVTKMALRTLFCSVPILDKSTVQRCTSSRRTPG